MLKISFPKIYLRKSIEIDGKRYKVFRHLKVKPKKGGSPAIFRVRFRFRNLPIKVNKFLSIIPAPFLIAKKGFNDKLWLIRDVHFQGIYQWESIEAAKDYPKSFIFKVMTKRAVPGSVKYEIIPEKKISAYIETLNPL